LGGAPSGFRKFLSYYRQFDELSPDEVSRELRARRDEELRRHPAQQPPLDLSGAAWHSPPHPEIVNAATFALRRAVNDYADPTAGPLRTALGNAHDVDPERIVVGHGAGELLRAALGALAAGGEVAVVWPGWGPLPQLVAEAGATPVPVAEASGETTVVLTRPCDPTGAVMPLAGVRRLADSLAPEAWLILDEALAGFLPDGEDELVDHPRVLHVRSFSKAHAMAGFRIGYAVLPEGADLPLAPVLGVGAPAQAGALWAVENGAGAARRRRRHADTERARLTEALADTPFTPAPGHGPYVWIAAPDGQALAEALAARRVFVAPGTAWGDAEHVRVTLRDAAAMDRLVSALREA
jgi:histidinol-phosphate/aromatic aminotransferase/cobyric acid decarboxylase-like protein